MEMVGVYLATSNPEKVEPSVVGVSQQILEALEANTAGELCFESDANSELLAGLVEIFEELGCGPELDSTKTLAVVEGILCIVKKGGDV